MIYLFPNKKNNKTQKKTLSISKNDIALDIQKTKDNKTTNTISNVGNTILVRRSVPATATPRRGYLTTTFGYLLFYRIILIKVNKHATVVISIPSLGN